MEKSNVTPFKKDKKEYKVVPFSMTSEVKQEERNGVPVGIIEGYGATFDLDRGDDIIMPGAFIQTIAAHRKAGRPIRMFYQHDSHQVLGGYPIADVREDSKGLWVRGEINLTKGQIGEYVYSLAKQGIVSDMSIGFSFPNMEAFEWKEEDDGRIIRVIKEVNLWEISPVTEPMNPEAQILAVKHAAETNDEGMAVRIGSAVLDTCNSIADVENLLKLGGFSQKARKKLISFIKNSKERDVVEESEGEEHRDDAESKATLEAIGSKLEGFKRQQAIDEIKRNA